MKNRLCLPNQSFHHPHSIIIPISLHYPLISFTCYICILRPLMPPIIPTLIRPPTLLHKTLLPIIFLTLLTPLRRLIFPIFLLFVALFLRLMYSPTIVLSGTIHRHQLQRLRLGSVYELVLRAGRHDYYVGGFNILRANRSSMSVIVVSTSLRSIR